MNECFLILIAFELILSFCRPKALQLLSSITGPAHPLALVAYEQLAITTATLGGAARGAEVLEKVVVQAYTFDHAMHHPIIMLTCLMLQ